MYVVSLIFIVLFTRCYGLVIVLSLFLILEQIFYPLFLTEYCMENIEV